MERKILEFLKHANFILLFQNETSPTVNYSITLRHPMLFGRDRKIIIKTFFPLSIYANMTLLKILTEQDHNDFISEYRKDFFLQQSVVLMFQRNTLSKWINTETYKNIKEDIYSLFKQNKNKNI